MTDLIRRLGADEASAESPGVTIAPVGGPASAARPAVGTIGWQRQ